MRGLPVFLNTKSDYEYIKNENIEGWKDKWRLLLEGRFIANGNDLIEDINAQLFRLGFTVEEIESAINFSGLTNREIEWRESQPDRFELVNGSWVEVEGWLEARTADQLTNAKAIKFEELQQEKRRRRDSGITINGVLFDTDLNADAKYTKMLLACQISPTYTIPDWKASDGVFVEMTGLLVLQVMQTFGAYESAITSKQKQKIAAIEAMTTIDDVENYDVTSGWD